MQHWNPDQYAEHARFVSDLGTPVVELLAPRTGERILDLGCGDGVLTMKLHGFGCQVVGVDSSSDMISVAQSKGLDARVMDGQALRFDSEFDAVFSNAALHWMKRPEKVIAGVWRALKPAGRFVGEFGGYGNIAKITSAIESALSARGVVVPSPWFFPRLEDYQRLLEQGGFTVANISLFPRPTPLPGDVVDWLQTFAQPYTNSLAEADRSDLIAEVTETLRVQLRDDDGNWVADYVRLRFAASKSSSATVSRDVR